MACCRRLDCVEQRKAARGTKVGARDSSRFFLLRLIFLSLAAFSLLATNLTPLTGYDKTKILVVCPQFRYNAVLALSALSGGNR